MRLLLRDLHADDADIRPLSLSACPEGVCPATRTDASTLLIVSWRISCSLGAVRTVHYRYTPFGGASGSRDNVPPILDAHCVIFHTRKLCLKSLRTLI